MHDQSHNPSIIILFSRTNYANYSVCVWVCIWFRSFLMIIITKIVAHINHIAATYVVVIQVDNIHSIENRSQVKVWNAITKPCHMPFPRSPSAAFLTTTTTSPQHYSSFLSSHPFPSVFTCKSSKHFITAFLSLQCWRSTGKRVQFLHEFCFYWDSEGNLPRPVIFSFSVHFAYFWSKKTKSKFCRGNPIIGSYSTVLYAYMVCLERCTGFSLLLEFLPLILEIERFWIVVLKDFQRKKAYMYIARMYFCIF